MSSTYQMTWPINDPRVPLADLLGQAGYDVQQSLAHAGLQPAGAPEWRIRQRHGLRLEVSVPVVGEHPDLAPAERQVRPCGTHAAYARHRRNGEPIDEACQTAERRYQAQIKRRTRAAARVAAPTEVAS